MRTFEESSKLMSYDSAASAQQGLRLGQFIPHFQPIVALRTGQLAGFEILARWYHPQRGLVLPDQFISLAEKQGWIHSLTLELLRKAFEAARSIPEPLTLSINIFARTILRGADRGGDQMVVVDDGDQNPCGVCWIRSGRRS